MLLQTKKALFTIKKYLRVEKMAYLNIKDKEFNYNEKIRLNHKDLYKFINNNTKGKYIEVSSNFSKNEYTIKTYDLLVYELENEKVLQQIIIISCTYNIFWKIFESIYLFDNQINY